MTWLNNTQDTSDNPLLDRIKSLEDQLYQANHNIDEKMEMLEERGFNVVNLNSQLEKTSVKLAQAEEELKRLRLRTSTVCS